jgi:anti-anti-sigma factor
MPITTQDYDKVCVLGLQGDLVGDEPSMIRKVVDDAMNNRQIADFVVDFANCSFVDSQGLETLLWVKRRSDQLFGRVKLIHVDDNCRKILEVTRMDSRFESCLDLASALKMMR